MNVQPACDRGLIYWICKLDEYDCENFHKSLAAEIGDGVDLKLSRLRLFMGFPVADYGLATLLLCHRKLKNYWKPFGLHFQYIPFISLIERLPVLVSGATCGLALSKVLYGKALRFTYPQIRHFRFLFVYTLFYDWSSE